MTCLAAFPCSLPTAPIPEDIDATAVASEFQSELDHTTAENFTEDAVWKDVYALTGTLRSFFSSSSISQALKKTSERAQVHSFILDPKSVRVSRLPGGTSWVEARYSFETTASPPTICSAIISLTPVDGGKWKIWTMRTILEQLKSQPNVDELQPAGDTEVTNGHLEVTHFDCVVVGGGIYISFSSITTIISFTSSVTTSLNIYRSGGLEYGRQGESYATVMCRVGQVPESW